LLAAIAAVIYGCVRNPAILTVVRNIIIPIRNVIPVRNVIPIQRVISTPVQRVSVQPVCEERVMRVRPVYQEKLVRVRPVYQQRRLTPVRPERCVRPVTFVPVRPVCCERVEPVRIVGQQVCKPCIQPVRCEQVQQECTPARLQPIEVKTVDNYSVVVILFTDWLSRQVV